MSASKEDSLAYQRGYAAGRLKQDRDAERDARHANDQALMDKIYLALLPFAFEQSTWKIGDNLINSSEERIDFAARIARKAFNGKPRL